ncbi:hypothetical protein SteCoe_25941 [Stentor coeruleus]|uniref:Uncharacterized protein n=1 Tax=Stentor coeruleus TaxID=5963 RepID=A0A1R2BE23_9CILI|nr:hypothetical protein SteCoe_25941 [Stentor coeruleus]
MENIHTKVGSSYTYQPLKDEIDTITNIQSRIGSLNFEDLVFYSSWYGKQLRISKQSNELHDLIWQRVKDLTISETLNIEELIIIAKNMLKNPKSPKYFDLIINHLINHPTKYLNMEQVATIIDLGFNKGNSLNKSILFQALELLEKRISQSYNGNKLLNVLEICSDVNHLSPNSINCIKKISLLFENKVDVISDDDYLKVFKIYNKSDCINKSFLSVSFKFLNMIYTEQTQGLPIKYLFRIVECLSGIIRRRSLYISHFIRSALLNDIAEKITIEDLKDENYGKILESILHINTNVSSKILEVFKKKFEEETIVDHSYVLCYHGLVHSGYYTNIPPFKIINLNHWSDMPIIEILKIFNTAYNSKLELSAKLVVLLQEETMKVLHSFLSTELLSNALEFINAVENIELFKKPLTYINRNIEFCLNLLVKNHKNLNITCIVSSLLKLYTFCPDITKSYLIEMSKMYSGNELIKVIFIRNGYSLKALSILLEICEGKVPEESIYPIFGHIYEDSLQMDVQSLAKFINKLDGKVYEEENFECNAQTFFNFLRNKNLSSYFSPFTTNIIHYLENLNDEKLAEPKALKICRFIAMCEAVTPNLATKVLDIHINKFIKDHESFLYLCQYHSDPNFMWKIYKRVIPEYVSVFQMIDMKNLCSRINAFSQTPFKNEEINEQFLESYMDKIRKWHPLYIEELFYIMENIHYNSKVMNYNVIEKFINSVGERIICDDCGLNLINAIRGIKAFCKFPYKGSMVFQKLFSDIGRLYLKFNEDQKVEIIQALGDRGFCNKEVFKIVIKDLIKKYEFKESIINSLAAVCDVNLHNEPFVPVLYEQVDSIIKSRQKMINHSLVIKSAYSLAHNNASIDKLESLMNMQVKAKDRTKLFFRKTLIMLYYFENYGISSIYSSDKIYYQKFIDHFALYGIKKQDLKSLEISLKNVGIEALSMVDYKGMHVPLFVPKSNTVIIPKSISVTTYDEKDLRGEFNLLIKILKKAGAAVHLISPNPEPKELQELSEFISRY